MSGALGDYLAMGGYGAFVWPAYALSVAVLGGLVAYSLRARRHLERELGAAPPRPAGGDADAPQA